MDQNASDGDLAAFTDRLVTVLLSEPDRVRRLITGTGFAEPDIEPLTASMHFGADADDAYSFVSGLLGWMLTDLDDAGRERALADLRATLRAHETSDGVLYPSATWLITLTRA
ncbi:hypothetical protein ACIBAG_27985 [Streptomyces sp. NPDC051243]|uniref:hypothetical protein n=1 Tax=Streptomyces sp. NPDC051243 TaxID=3365646 RepID=UPI0037926DA3